MNKLTKKQREALEREYSESMLAIQKIEEQEDEAMQKKINGKPTGVYQEVKANSLRGIFEDSYGQNSYYVEIRNHED